MGQSPPGAAGSSTEIPLDEKGRSGDPVALEDIGEAPERSGAAVPLGREPTGIGGADASKKDFTQGSVLTFPQRSRPLFWLPWKAVFAVVAFVAVAMILAISSPLLALRKFTIEGTKNVSQDEIVTALSPLLGQPLTQLDDAKVLSLLKPIEGIESASVRRVPPETLLVRVVERTPVAILKDGDNFVLVDPVGKKLSPLSDPKSVSLPVIDNQNSAGDEETFKAITSVLEEITDPLRSQLVTASAPSAQGVQFTLADGKKVLWGDTTEADLKTRVLLALLGRHVADSPDKPAGPPVREYDVSSPHHPVTR